jgi:heat shock protein HslJ
MMKLARSSQVAVTAVVLLAFASMKAESADGESATWILQQGADISLHNARKPELRMEAQKLTGSTGCNSFSATVSERSNKRVAIEEIIRTRMLCEPNQNKIENALVRALEKTEVIRENGKALAFLSGDGATLLVWKRPGKSSSVKKSSTVRRNHHTHRVARAHRTHRNTCCRQRARADFHLQYMIAHVQYIIGHRYDCSRSNVDGRRTLILPQLDIKQLRQRQNCASSKARRPIMTHL